MSGILLHNAGNSPAVAIEKHDATGKKINSPRRWFSVAQPKGIGFLVVFDFALEILKR